jgi:hypothetical protein
MYCPLEIFMATRKINKDLSMALAMFSLHQEKVFLNHLRDFDGI